MSKRIPPINNVAMTGQLVSDPRVVQISSQVSYVEFLFACNQKYRTSSGESREKTVFIPVRTWGKLSEDCLSGLCQKSAIYLEGELESAPKEHGGRINIRASRVEFLDGGVVNADRDSSIGRR